MSEATVRRHTGAECRGTYCKRTLFLCSPSLRRYSPPPPPPFSLSVFLHYSLAAGGHQRPDWGWFILPLSCLLPDCLCNGEISFLLLSLPPLHSRSSATEGMRMRIRGLTFSLMHCPTLSAPSFASCRMAPHQLCLPHQPSVCGECVSTSTAGHYC